MLDHAGATRTTASTIRFHHSFRIGRDPRELPAGTYTIHTVEEMYQGGFDPVFVATSVDLVVEARGGSTSRVIRPADLRAALDRDGFGQDELSENPDRGRADGFTAAVLDSRV